MNREVATQLVAPFYEALNHPASRDVAALIEQVAAPDWRSFSGEGVSKGRDEFIEQVVGFGKAIPDLTWAVKDVLADGDRIIVRSEASGTPASAFMGVPHGGQRSRSWPSISTPSATASSSWRITSRTGPGPFASSARSSPAAAHSPRPNRSPSMTPLAATKTDQRIKFLAWALGVTHVVFGATKLAAIPALVAQFQAWQLPS